MTGIDTPARSVALIAVASLMSTPALAGSMRCGTNLITEGDTQIEVLADCGEPDTIERVPAPAFPGFGHGIYGNPYAQPLQPVSVEIWTYNFGPRRLIRQLRLEGGQVAEIRTLGYGF